MAGVRTVSGRSQQERTVQGRRKAKANVSCHLTHAVHTLRVSHAVHPLPLPCPSQSRGAWSCIRNSLCCLHHLLPGSLCGHCGGGKTCTVYGAFASVSSDGVSLLLSLWSTTLLCRPSCSWCSLASLTTCWVSAGTTNSSCPPSLRCRCLLLTPARPPSWFLFPSDQYSASL